MKFGQEAHQVLQRATEPIDRPGHDDIEFAGASILPKPVKGRPLIPSLGARYVSTVACETSQNVALAHSLGYFFGRMHTANALTRIPASEV